MKAGPIAFAIYYTAAVMTPGHFGWGDDTMWWFGFCFCLACLA